MQRGKPTREELPTERRSPLGGSDAEPSPKILQPSRPRFLGLAGWLNAPRSTPHRVPAEGQIPQEAVVEFGLRPAFTENFQLIEIEEGLRLIATVRDPGGSPLRELGDLLARTLALRRQPMAQFILSKRVTSSW